MIPRVFSFINKRRPLCLLMLGVAAVWAPRAIGAPPRETTLKDQGFVATYYEPSENSNAVGVLVLGDSEGGRPTLIAGPLLWLSAADDQMWPAAAMAEAIWRAPLAAAAVL